jgi:hypothetical protein
MCAFLQLCGSASAQTKPGIVVSTNRQELSIEAPAGTYLPQPFAVRGAAKMGNYQLPELEPPDRPGEVMADRSSMLAGLVRACDRPSCRQITIGLNSPLATNQTFILRVNEYLPDGGAVTFRFTTSQSVAAAATTATIAKGANAYDQLDELVLTSTNPVKLSSPITVKRIYYRLKDGVPTLEEELFTGTSTWHTDQLYEVHLDRKLIEGVTHVLVIDNGITDSGGANVRAEGKVELAAPPKKPEDRRLDASLATVAAAKQKAVFELTANLVPKRVFQIGDTNWLWEPRFVIDLGLRSTKSNNSVVVAPLNFRNVFFEDVFALQPPKGPRPTLRTRDVKDKRGRAQSAWDAWRAAPWYRLSDIELTIGPKAEFDRNFKRKNVLGALRFDFNFHRWLATMSKKREILENDLNYGKPVASQIVFNYGWKLVPFVAFDFGGHVNNQTVSKKGTSVFVPRHKIFRSYVGFVSTTEWNMFGLPMSLNIEESWVYLAARETIGFTTDTTAKLRQLRGFHPRSKVTLDFNFDPSRHYTFTVGFENGRLAPNFEYLNKLTGGFRVVY